MLQEKSHERKDKVGWADGRIRIYATEGDGRESSWTAQSSGKVGKGEGKIWSLWGYGQEIIRNWS